MMDTERTNDTAADRYIETLRPSQGALIRGLDGIWKPAAAGLACTPPVIHKTVVEEAHRRARHILPHMGNEYWREFADSLSDMIAVAQYASELKRRDPLDRPPWISAEYWAEL